MIEQPTLALHAHNEFSWLGTAMSGLHNFVTTNHFLFCFIFCIYVCLSVLL